MVSKPGKILSKVNSPSDIKKLGKRELLQLADELRDYILDIVSYHTGHLGASLGVVELTIALHYVFNTPKDRLVWDVGHQAYGHKILTGRRDAFHTNRKLDGISGFPKMAESEYDAFGVGHSSTSISAIIGMAVASRLKGEKNINHIAVIGDGALTAGMSFEALNHGGFEKPNILIVLNDNGIAIDQNVGALKEYFTKITASPLYNRIKDKLWRFLGGKRRSENISIRFVRKVGTAIKSSFLKKSNLFESLGFRYFGPVDGHDLPTLIKLLDDLKSIKGPKILHCITVKGKGYEHAEKEQTKFHAPGKFNKKTGEIIENCDKKLPPKYQVVFGRTIIELAEMNEKVIGVTPAMPTGCSLNLMMHKMPKRAFDVGIAEQHSVTFSAGMATKGYIPFCNIYSSFMQRSYDQVIHDVALQKLNVVFCLDRSGLVGEDGPTHHGAYDLSFFRCIPNMTISSPLNESELRNLMYTSQLENKGSFVIRYPKGRGVMPEWKTPFKEIEIGKGQKIKDGNEIAVLSLGHPGNFVIEAASELSNKHGIEIAHYDMRFLKPIDEEILHEVFAKFKKVITIEDGTIIGGLASAIQDFMVQNRYSAKIIKLGIPDEFIEQGTIDELHHVCGYDKEAIVKNVLENSTP